MTVHQFWLEFLNRKRGSFLMRIFVRFCTIVIFSIMLFTAVPKVLVAAAGEPQIKVGLVSLNSAVLEISCRGGLTVEVHKESIFGVSKDWRTLEGTESGAVQTFTISISPQSAELLVRTSAGFGVKVSGPIRFTSVDTNIPLRINNREYYGIAEIAPPRTSGGSESGGANTGGVATPLTVILHLQLEQYLEGVLAGEVPASWPAEALKAQAVACRTNVMSWGARHSGTEFDICDGTHCQVFKGAATSASISKAVQDTVGEIIRYGGKLINAYFHSSSGGRTENNEDVWPGSEQSPSRAFPYLRAVDDYDQASPYYSWAVSKFYTIDEFAAHLKIDGRGDLTVETVAGTNQVPVRYRFARSGGTAKTYTREELRNLLALPSPRMDFYTITPEQIAEALRKLSLRGPVVFEGVKSDPTGTDGGGGSGAGAGGSARDGAGADGASFILDLRLQLGIDAVRETGNFTFKTGTFIVIGGRGYGHGIGMSQWGAKGMADQGYTYREILSHYYRGTNVEKVY